MSSAKILRGAFVGLLAVLPAVFVFTGCGQGKNSARKAEETLIRSEEELLKGKAAYNIKDYKAAVMSFSLAAELGNPEAMYRLGKCFLDGTGVEKDTAEAIAFFRKAEAAVYRMDPQVQFAIGELFFNGDDVERNESEAVKWYRKAAEQGCAEAQYKLGECYEFGEGVPQDYDEALKWYFKAPDNPSYVVKSVRLTGYSRNWNPDDPDKRQELVDRICRILSIQLGRTPMFPRRGEGSDLPQMVERLRCEIPELESVRIWRGLPDELRFQLHERIPVANLGERFYIDRTGMVLDKSEYGDVVIPLPYLVCSPSTARGSDDLSAFQRGETLSSTAIRTALTFIRLVENGEFTEKSSEANSRIFITVNYIYVADNNLQCGISYNGDPRKFLVLLPLNVTEKEFRSDYFGRLIPCLENAIRNKSDKNEQIIDLRYKDRVIIRESKAESSPAKMQAQIDAENKAKAEAERKAKEAAEAKAKAEAERKAKEAAEAKVEPKKTEPKTDPKKPDPPKTQYLTPDQIKIGTTPVKTQAQIDAENRAKSAAEARARAEAKARADAVKELQNAAAGGGKPGTYGTQTPGQEGVLPDAATRRYLIELEAHIKPQWNRYSPSETEFNKNSVSTWPVAHITVAKDGRVSRAVIVKKSGVAAVDDAASRLLADLKVVPVPPAAATFPVTLTIE